MTGVKYNGTRQPHDPLANLVSKWHRRAKIPHMGGIGGHKRTCKGLFTESANRLPEPGLNHPAHAGVVRHTVPTKHYSRFLD